MPQGLLKSLFVGIVLSAAVVDVAYAEFFSLYSLLRSNDEKSCYFEGGWGHLRKQDFWLCGKHQPEKCSDKTVGPEDNPDRMTNGDHFVYSGTTYWCCGGTTTQKGKFVKGDKWIIRTEPFTETLNGETCTGVNYWNICNEIDPTYSQRTCTPIVKSEPTTTNCPAGYFMRNGYCTAECGTGYAFESATSNQCVSCETTDKQAIVNGICKRCGSNEIMDSSTRQCVSTKSVTADMLRIATSAHETCWMCVDPVSLRYCLQYVTLGGRISNNSALVSQCSIDSKYDPAMSSLLKPNQSK